jgi:sugar-specific transcriptional regulator TrmB
VCPPPEPCTPCANSEEEERLQQEIAEAEEEIAKLKKEEEDNYDAKTNVEDEIEEVLNFF